MMGFGKSRKERVIARLQTRVNALMCLYPSYFLKYLKSGGICSFLVGIKNPSALRK